QMIYLMDFFFQAEDGIRDRNVTGVQTCALPISALKPLPFAPRLKQQLAHRARCAAACRVMIERSQWFDADHQRGLPRGCGEKGSWQSTGPIIRTNAAPFAIH